STDPALIRDQQHAGILEVLAVVQHHGFVPDGRAGGVEAVAAHLPGGDEVASVGSPGREPVAVDQQVEGCGKDEILRRRRDQWITLPHATVLAARIARRPALEHTATTPPVATS